MWNYRAFKTILKNGESYYSVKEFHKIPSNRWDRKLKKRYQYLWTEDDMEPVGETKKELIKCLEMMLKDVKHYRTKVIKGKE